jgi:MFS family permease
VQYTAVAKGVLLVGKMINGFAVGGLLAVGTTYASEASSFESSNYTMLTYIQISPPRLRGVLLGGLAFFVIVMQLIGLAVVRCYVPNLSPSAFRTVFALQWLVGALPMIGFLLSPE